MFLTRDEIRELTGYTRYVKQYEWLSENGYQFDIRSDGRPNILKQQLFERQCEKVESTPVPDLSWMEEAS